MPKFWKTEMGRMLAAKKYKAAMILLAFLIIPCVARADTNIDNCTTLDVPGETYLLTQNISGHNDINNYCLYSNTQNDIILDCQNNWIICDSETAISTVASSNLTIQNCYVQNCSSQAVIFSNEENINLLNDTILVKTNANGLVFNDGIDGINSDMLIINTSDDSNSNAINFDNALNAYFSNLYINLGNNSAYALFFGISDNVTIDKFSIITDSTGDDMNNYYDLAIYACLNENGTLTMENGCYNTTDVILNDGCDGWLNVDNINISCPYPPEEPACTPSWNCTAWGECIRGQQTRECTDLNQCQNETGKPATTQACLKGLPNATYNISSDCCPISTFYCTDNETLVQLWNTSQGVSWAVEDCEFGCDNTTDSCMPPSGQQNLLLFGVIVAMCVLGALFWRWSRR